MILFQVLLGTCFSINPGHSSEAQLISLKVLPDKNLDNIYGSEAFTEDSLTKT